MSSLPGQTPEIFCDSLYPGFKIKTGTLFSAYSLIIEKGTPFYELYRFDAVRQEAGMQTGIPSDGGGGVPDHEDDTAHFKRRPVITGMRFPILQSRDMSADTILVTGNVSIISVWDLAHPHWSTMYGIPIRGICTRICQNVKIFTIAICSIR